MNKVELEKWNAAEAYGLGLWSQRQKKCKCVKSLKEYCCNAQ